MNTLSLHLPITQVGGRFGAGFRHAAAALLAGLEQAYKLRQTRRYLAEMDDHMLSDIGVSRAQVLFEVDHPHR